MLDMTEVQSIDKQPWMQKIGFCLNKNADELSSSIEEWYHKTHEACEQVCMAYCVNFNHITKYEQVDLNSKKKLVKITEFQFFCCEYLIQCVSVIL